MGAIVTDLERYVRLDKRHHHFAQIPDPWHYRALSKIPAVLEAYKEGRVFQGTGDSALHGGDQYLVWFSYSAEGQPLQEWGFDPPPMIS